MPSVRDALDHLQDLFGEASGLRDFVEAANAPQSFFDLYTPLRALAAAWLIACTLLCALRITRWLLPQCGVPMRWSSIFCVGMWLSTAGFHALRSLSAFRLSWALLACSALTLGVALARPQHAPLAWTLRREWRALRAVARCVQRGRYPLWTVFGGFGALLAIRALVIPPLGWDTLTYHAPRAAQWVQSGRFTFDDGVGSYNFYRHFFSGGEVLLAWAMLPFHSDLLANLASVAEWIGVGLASWALARAIGLKEPFASTSAAVVMFAPTLQLEVNSGYVELPLNAALLHGIAIGLACLRRPKIGAVVLCAMSLGVAAGIKLPGAPPAAIFAGLVSLRWLATRSIAWKPKLLTLAASAFVALVPAAPWMLRAFQDTGYPLSPLPVRVLGHTLGVASSAMHWYGERKLAPYTWRVEKMALLHVFSQLSDLNESLGTLAFIPLALFPVGLVALARRRPLAALGLLAAVIAPVLTHFSEGMTPVRLLRSVSASRFLMPALALAVPVSLAWCTPGRYRSSAYRWLLLTYPVAMSVFAMRRGFIEWENRELVIVGVVATQLGLLTVLCFRRRPRLGAAVGVIAWLALCSVVQVRRDQTRELAYGKSYALHNFPRYWADGVARVDTADLTPHRIAITGGPDHSSDKWFHYFYMGRRLQNWIGYIVPTRDGKTAQFGPGGDLAERADLNSWLPRLAAAQIDDVLTFPPRSIEQGWMEATPEHFEKMAGNDEFGLFRFKR
jgi:hypothetical protein